MGPRRCSSSTAVSSLASTCPGRARASRCARAWSATVCVVAAWVRLRLVATRRSNSASTCRAASRSVNPVLSRRRSPALSLQHTHHSLLSRRLYKKPMDVSPPVARRSGAVISCVRCSSVGVAASLLLPLPPGRRAARHLHRFARVPGANLRGRELPGPPHLHRRELPPPRHPLHRQLRQLDQVRHVAGAPVLPAHLQLRPFGGQPARVGTAADRRVHHLIQLVLGHGGFHALAPRAAPRQRVARYARSIRVSSAAVC